MGILSPLTPRLLEYTNNEQLPIELKGKVLSTFPVKTKCKNCLNPKQWVTQINKYNERWAYFHRWLSVLLSLTLQESFQSSCILTKKKKKKGFPKWCPRCHGKWLFICPNSSRVVAILTLYTSLKIVSARAPHPPSPSDTWWSSWTSSTDRPRHAKCTTKSIMPDAFQIFSLVH